MDISTFKIGSLFRFFLQITKTTINILLLLQNFSKWMSIQRDQILYKVSKALEIRFCAIFQRQIQLVNNTYWHQIRANCIPDMIFFLYLSKSIYNCCRWAPTTFCSSTEWWLSSVGSREISAKVFPPPPRSIFEFKYFLHHWDQHLSSNFSSTTETRPSALGKSDPFCGPSNPWHLFTKDYTIFCRPSNPQYLFPKNYAIFFWQIIDINKKFCTVSINFLLQLFKLFSFLG